MYYVTTQRTGQERLNLALRELQADSPGFAALSMLQSRWNTSSITLSLYKSLSAQECIQRRPNSKQVFIHTAVNTSVQL